jgi:hypothetical protein
MPPGRFADIPLKGEWGAYILSGISIPNSHMPVYIISLVTFDNANLKFLISHHQLLPK